MKLIFNTYKFKLYPNKQQICLLNKHFGCVRFVYNYFLNQRKEQYIKTNKSDRYYEQSKKLTELKNTNEYAFLNEVNGQSLQQALRNLEKAYVSFFKGNTRFPKFKSKKSRNSFNIPQRVFVKSNSVVIPKFQESIKIRKHRDICGNIKSATISKDNDGKFYISILTEQNIELNENTNIKSVGIDLGLKDFVITSDGEIYKNYKYTKKYEKKLRAEQKHLDKKKVGSNSFEKQKRKVAKLHEKIANSRKDNLHKVSTSLVKKYDIICCEDLNISGMSKNHKLAKSVFDAGWYMFLCFLEYKCDRKNKTLIRVNRYFPSSQTCNICGYINHDIKNFSIRNWICPNCGTEHNRDINAAKNILREGLKSLSAGTVDYTNGDDVRLACKQSSVKLEA